MLGAVGSDAGWRRRGRLRHSGNRGYSGKYPSKVPVSWHFAGWMPVATAFSPCWLRAESCNPAEAGRLDAMLPSALRAAPMYLWRTSNSLPLHRSLAEWRWRRRAHPAVARVGVWFIRKGLGSNFTHRREADFGPGTDGGLICVHSRRQRRLQARRGRSLIP